MILSCVVISTLVCTCTPCSTSDRIGSRLTCRSSSSKFTQSFRCVPVHICRWCKLDGPWRWTWRCCNPDAQPAGCTKSHVTIDVSLQFCDNVVVPDYCGLRNIEFCHLCREFGAASWKAALDLIWTMWECSKLQHSFEQWGEIARNACRISYDVNLFSIFFFSEEVTWV